MKKISQTLCLAALTLSSAAFANQSGHFYVSADAGVFQGDFSNTYLDQVDVLQANLAQSVQQHGYTAGLALGYSKLLSPFYFLGAELSGNIEGHNASFQAGPLNEFSDAVQIQNHVDLTFVPGLMLNDTISAYLKIGLSYASIKDSLTSPAGYTPIITNYNSNKSTLGFAAGLGLTKALTERIKLFTEANYHDYGTVDFSNFQNFTATYTHSAHVYSYDVVVGVTYLLNI